jgi:predicted glycoside hydrolase/deacetylase ChbG (UPF0249 family)
MTLTANRASGRPNAPARRRLEPGDIARALGYEAGSKLLIIHADDMGLSRSVNRAILEALDGGYLSSASMMPPCRAVGCVDWRSVSERFDIGVHLTFTSEYAACRCRPVFPAGSAQSLVDADGCFRSSAMAFARSASLDEVEMEARGQIEFAIESGLRPTHVDVHMFALYANPGLCRVVQHAADGFDLPWLAVRTGTRPEFRPVASVFEDAGILLDNLLMAPPSVSWNDLTDWYIASLKALPPGVTQLIVHPGIADAELREITAGHVAYGAVWRESDFAAISAPRFRSVLEKEKIQLVDWRGLRGAMRKLQEVA